MRINLEKSLEELENKKLGDSDLKSHFVTECQRLVRVPIKDLTVENLRMLIGQKIGLSYLIPLALDQLEKDPLSEGNMYKGDLLSNVASVEKSFWDNNPDLNNRLVEIKNELEILSETIDKQLFAST